MSHTGQGLAAEAPTASSSRSTPARVPAVRPAWLAGCGVAAALIAVLLAPEPAARAARATETAVAGIALTPSAGEAGARAESARIAERYLGGQLRLRAAGRVLDIRRADLGASIALPHLEALITSAQTATSPLRRLHDAALFGHPLRLPMPARLDEARTTALLVPLKDAVDRDPIEAHVDPRKKQAVHSVPGVALDVHGSLEQIDRALASGASEVELPLLSISARRTLSRYSHVEMNAVLGETTTRYNQAQAARDRTHNLETTAERVDGYVIEPGEVFDFNAVVGDRTQFNGYKLAPVISYGQLVDGVGGGTCQIASTLHGAVFFAGLQILERHPHSRPSFYAKLGLDAAVAYGSLNFKFRNDRPYPIVLEMTVDRGLVRAAVHGKARTRTVSFMRRIDGMKPFGEKVVEDAQLPRGTRLLAQRGIPGFTVTRFRVVRDEETGAATRERNTDSYPPTEEVIRIGTGPELAPDAEHPRNDPHPEYVADELLTATQGPGIEGTREERTAGRTGTYGWTERQGMRAGSGSGMLAGL